MKLKKWKKFEKFLMKEGAFKKYYKNIAEEGVGLRYVDEHPGLYVGGAFTWSRTKQGHDYWEELDSKWMKRLEK